MDNRSLSYIRWKYQYHIVFIPKYRKKVLYGKSRGCGQKVGPPPRPFQVGPVDKLAFFIIY